MSGKQRSAIELKGDMVAHIVQDKKYFWEKLISQRLIQSWHQNGITKRIAVCVRQTLLVEAIRLFGGNARKAMNGKQL